MVIKHQISVNYLKNMGLPLFTIKISYKLQLKCSRDQMIPEIMKRLFQYRNKKPCNLRQSSQFHVHPARTIFTGIESIKFPGPEI